MKGMPAELRLEILAYAPTAFIACRNCEVALQEAGVSRSVREEQFRTGLPLELVQEYDHHFDGCESSRPGTEGGSPSTSPSGVGARLSGGRSDTASGTTRHSP
jgi:hypothetical protein